MDKDGFSVIEGGLGNDDNRPRAMDGSVDPYNRPPKAIDSAELERAENDLRAQAKALFREIETTYWELGRVLYEVYDGIPGGYRDLIRGQGARASRKALFEKWGFASFEDYCEREIGINRRSGQNLRFAYYTFEIRLNLGPELKEQIKALGRSKVYLLAMIVEETDVVEWLEKAKKMSHDELKKAIRVAKDAKKNKTSGSSSGDDEQSLDDAADDLAAKDAPAPEQLHTLQTSLYDAQWKTWESAFNKAKALSGSEKIGHNIELICQDFLANNDFGSDAGKDIRTYLAKIERILQKKLIVIDPHTGTPVYGTDLLWALVKEKAAAAQAEMEAAKEAEAAKPEPEPEPEIDDGKPPKRRRGRPPKNQLPLSSPPVPDEN